jgi:hypothetical protein
MMETRDRGWVLSNSHGSVGWRNASETERRSIKKRNAKRERRFWMLRILEFHAIGENLGRTVLEWHRISNEMSAATWR